MAFPASCPEGITPDPDIAGKSLRIGVRVAIYIQGVLALWPMLIHPVGKFDRADQAEKTYELVRRSNLSGMALLITNGALLVAAYIKVASRQLSAYHACVILYLSWYIFLCALIAGVGALSAAKQYRLVPVSHPLASRGTSRSARWYWQWSKASLRVVQVVPLLALYVHLIGIGVLGILLFRNVRAFSHRGGPDDSDCAEATVVWMLGFTVRIVDPHIRRFWMGVYISAVVPYLGVAGAIIVIAVLCIVIILAAAVPLLTIVPLLAAPVVVCCRRAHPRLEADMHKFVLYGASTFLVSSVVGTVLVLLILSTEKTITVNPVADGEAAWGFGQVLALLLILPLLYDTCTCVRKIFALRRTGSPSASVFWRADPTPQPSWHALVFGSEAHQAAPNPLNLLAMGDTA